MYRSRSELVSIYCYIVLYFHKSSSRYDPGEFVIEYIKFFTFLYHLYHVDTCCSLQIVKNKEL